MITTCHFVTVVIGITAAVCVHSQPNDSSLPNDCITASFIPSEAMVEENSCFSQIVIQNIDGHIIDTSAKGFIAPKDLVKIKRLYKKLQRKHAAYSKRLASLKKRKRSGDAITDLEESVKELKAMITDIEEILTTKKFIFSLRKKYGSTPYTIAEADSSVHINYDKTDPTLIHELTHVAQFMHGETDFIYASFGGGTFAFHKGFLCDKMDEVAAFRRQYAFAQELEYREFVPAGDFPVEDLSKLGNRTSKISHIKEIDIQLVSKMAENDDYFKAVYDSIPETNLNSNLSVAAIIHANHTGTRNAKLLNQMKASRIISDTIRASYREFAKRKAPYIYVY